MLFLFSALVKLNGQVPSMMNYQAIARNPDGSPITSRSIGIRISILENSANGNSVYSEIHHPQTNEFGLFNLLIGTGTSSTNFSVIDWYSGQDVWIQFEVDLTNTGNFLLMGSSQLVSVPFAFHSGKASSAPPVLLTLSSDQRDQLVKPADGMLILNTTSTSLNLHYQGAWYDIPALRINTEWKCGNPIVDSRDGRSYATVQIGNQCWMAENLNIGVAIAHTAEPSDNGIIEKFNYDNNANVGQTYGGLYSWNEMMGYSKTAGVQGICPEGWHIPTDEEWKTLEVTLGMSETDAAKSNTWRGTDQGSQVAPGGSAGFNVRYSGRMVPGFGYTGKDSYEYQWTSNESSDAAWRRCFDFASPLVGRYNTFPKNYGMSVRCVR
jgi:uncharacterized protein (TIGR02145 family)